MRKLEIYLPAFVALAVVTTIGAGQMVFLDSRDLKNVWGIVSEGTTLTLCIGGMFIIQGLRDKKDVYRPLFLGFLFLSVSYASDVIDEIRRQTDLIEHIFEDASQILGILLLVFGLFRWVGHNRKTNAELLHLVVTDYLTGAYTRRHLIEAVKIEAARSVRYGTPLSLVAFDLDRFKSVNDRFGHDAGDLVLKKTADLVLCHIRSSDVFARVGGEEFHILAPSANAAMARDLAEKLRAEIEKNTIEGAGPITASFGIAQFTAGESVESLLKRADMALYEAKRMGRNCVAVAG